MNEREEYGKIFVMGSSIKSQMENFFNKGRSLERIQNTKIFHTSSDSDHDFIYNFWYIEEEKFDLTSAFFTLALATQHSHKVLFLYQSNDLLKDEFSTHVLSILKTKGSFICKNLSEEKEERKLALFNSFGKKISLTSRSLLSKMKKEKEEKDEYSDDMFIDAEEMKKWDEMENIKKELEELHDVGEIYLVKEKDNIKGILLSCNCIAYSLDRIFNSTNLGDRIQQEEWKKFIEEKGLYEAEYIETASPNAKWIKQILFNTKMAFPVKKRRDKSKCDVIIPFKWSKVLRDEVLNEFQRFKETVKWEYYFKKPPNYFFNQLFSILYELYKEKNFVFSNAIVLKWKEHDKESYVVIRILEYPGISIEATSNSLDFTWRSFMRVGREIELFLKKESNVDVNRYAIDPMGKAHEVIELLDEDTRDPLLLPFTMKWFETPEKYENVLICTNPDCKSRIGSGVRKMICKNYPFCQKRIYCFRCGVLISRNGLKGDCCGDPMIWRRFNKEKGELEAISEEAIESGRNCLTKDDLYEVIESLESPNTNPFKNQLPNMLKMLDKDNPLFLKGFMTRAENYSRKLKRDINDICHEMWAKEFPIVYKEEKTILEKLCKRSKKLNDFIRTRIIVDTFHQLQNFIKELENRGYFWYFKPPRPNFFQHVIYVFVFTCNDPKKNHFPMEIQLMTETMLEDIDGMDDHCEYEDERVASSIR